MKKIIFDINDTLIPFESGYQTSIIKTFTDLNTPYSIRDIQIINNSIEDYTKYFNLYDISIFKYFIEERLKKKLPKNFIETWFKNIGESIPYTKDIELIKLLTKLSKKYELSVFTNFFTEPQTEKLKNYEILSYFNDVLGTDECKVKPYIDGFITICDTYKPEECIYIGNNLEKEIKPAKSIGMNTLLYDPNNIYNSYKENKIKKLGEITKYL